MITDQDRELLLRYAERNRQIKRLEEEQDFEKARVLDLIQQLRDGADKPVRLAGTAVQLSLGNRPKWQYTNMVTDLEAEVKEKKKYEQQMGLATRVDNFYPIVSEIDDTPTIPDEL